MAIFDGFWKAMGLTTSEDRDKALSEVASISARQDPAARFAVSMADHLEAKDHLTIRRALPGIERISADPVLRRADLAGASLAAAEGFIKDGRDNALGPELGTATREASVLMYSRDVRMHSRMDAPEPGQWSGKGVLSDELDKVNAQTANLVRRYLSVGPANQAAIAESARELGKRESYADLDRTYEAARMDAGGRISAMPDHLEHVAGEAVARSRAGLVAPDKVVELALLSSNALPREGPRSAFARGGADGPTINVVPDFAKGLAAYRDPDREEAIVADFRTSAGSPFHEIVNRRYRKDPDIQDAAQAPSAKSVELPAARSQAAFLARDAGRTV